MALHLHSQSSLLGSHQSKLTVLKERSGNLHPPCSISHLPPPRHVPWRSLSSALMGRPVQCLANTQTSELTVSRRSGNYHPDIWGFDFVQSLKSDYVGEECVKRVEKLIMDVKQMFDEEMGPLARLELINDIQRLGVGYHFENEIKRALYTIANSNNSLETEDDLHFVALGFWLLRQHGYEIAQDVFNRFKDEARNFKAELCDDVKGMLSLYEASHLALEGENILDEARAFTSKHLKDIRGTIDPNLDEQVSHSLELPLHWRMKRLEARWYINVYSRKVDVNPVLLELAMLDFNMVQATHQNDLKAASRWWKNVGLGSKLSFARDRLVENFLWTVGIIFEPQFGCCRTGVAKVNQLITTIDDIYDVYGTLDELELFTDVVERWDINAMERLPDYMKICFLALYNTINEMAYDTLIERGVEILPYLKKMWVDLCKAYLAEAKWYYKKYMPTLEEYLEVARMSIAGHVILGHAYFLLKQEITKEALECFDSYPSIIRWSSMILRLGDDLGTSTVELEKGDTAKSIQCYMHENDVSEEVAREHIINMIHDVWKKINEDQVDCRFPKPFIGAAVDLARMTLCIYQYGDGFGASDRETKDRIQSLLVDPVFIMKI